MNIEFFFDVPSSALTFRLVILSDTGDAVSLPYSILIRSRNPNKILTVTESQQVPATVRISQRDNEIDRLQYFSECELVKCIGDYSLDAIKNHFSKDPWCLNYLVNNWEFAKKKTTLSSYPYDVAFAISGNCNSNCIFCITRDLRRKYKNRYIDVNDWGKFHEVLKYSKSIGIPGPGEPLLHPQFEQLISNLELYCDKRCNVYMITNGLLINKHLEFLKKSIISTFDISLNAATKETYQRVMGIGQDKFETVINNIRALTEIRNKEKRGKKINITFVVINDNLHELSDFINLGNDLKVDGIFIRPYVVESSKQGISTPSPDILNPYHNPHFTDFLSKFKTTMNQSKVPVYAKPDLWNIRKENCAPHPCNLLYNKLYLHNDFYKVWPCCIIGDLGEIHPIDCDGQESFFEAWNSSIMVNLRKSMFDGPLNDCCRTCNVDLNI